MESPWRPIEDLPGAALGGFRVYVLVKGWNPAEDKFCYTIDCGYGDNGFAANRRIIEGAVGEFKRVVGYMPVPPLTPPEKRGAEEETPANE